jgi:hypothetical protein
VALIAPLATAPLKLHRAFHALSAPGLPAAEKQRLLSGAISGSISVVLAAWAIAGVSAVVGLYCLFAVMKDLRAAKEHAARVQQRP